MLEEIAALWLADALAGAATASLADGAEYLAALGGRVRMSDVMI